jgi:hypothetical protein
MGVGLREMSDMDGAVKDELMEEGIVVSSDAVEGADGRNLPRWSRRMDFASVAVVRWDTRWCENGAEMKGANEKTGRNR